MKDTEKSHVEQQPQPDIADAEAENPTHFKNSLKVSLYIWYIANHIIVSMLSTHYLFITGAEGL